MKFKVKVKLVGIGMLLVGGLLIAIAIMYAIDTARTNFIGTLILGIVIFTIGTGVCKAKIKDDK